MERSTASDHAERAGRPLILSHFSLPEAAFEERVSAAAAGGFDGIGLNAGVFRRMLDDGWTIVQMQGVLDRHDMALLEVEALRLFDLERAEDVFAMVEAFRPSHVQVVAPFEGDVPIGPGGERLAALAARAESFGTRLAFEFLPFTAIRDADEALALIAAAGNPANAGLCVDSWHVFRGSGPAQLARIPPERVTVVQFDDGPMQPVLADYLEDTMHYRNVPGEGEFDLVGFLQALPAEPPLSVEVIDDDLAGQPAADVARRLARATRAVLAQAGRS